MTDVGAQKITSLQRCVVRAREAYAAAGAEVRTNYNLQDAAILNVIRACDVAIDLANVHQYRELDLDILDAVIRNNLDDLLTFARAVRLEL